MENTNKDVNDVINQMKIIKFEGVFRKTWALFLKDPLILLILVTIPMLLAGFLTALITSMTLNWTASSWLVPFLSMIIISVVAAVLGLFAVSLVMRGANRIFHGHKLDLMETLTFVSANFVEAISLSIKVFIYVKGYLVVLYLLIAGILFPIAPGLSSILGMLFLLFLIVYFVVFLKKIINSTLAIAFLWSEETLDSTVALKKSVAYSNNLTWTIFLNNFLIGLVLGVASSIILAVFVPLFSSIGGVVGVTIIQFIAAGVMSIFSSAFLYCMKEQIEKFRGNVDIDKK